MHRYFACVYITKPHILLLMELVKQTPSDVSSIRVSQTLRSRLARIRARLTLKDGKDRTMEELLELLADVYEENEKEKFPDRMTTS